MDFSPSPVLAFDTDSTEFVRGVEVGRVWTLLSSGCPEAAAGTYHGTNARMIQRAAAATGYVAWLSKTTPGWIAVEFSRESKPH